MIRKAIITIISLLLLFIVWQVFFSQQYICDFSRERITIAEVHNGLFKEYIPQTGIVKRDSLTDSVFVEVRVDQIYSERFAPGLIATTTFNNRDYILSVSRVFPEIIQERFIVQLIADSLKDLESKNLRLRIELNKSYNALLLPVGGFYKDTGGDWVFVVEGDKAVKRTVKLGRKNTENFEVLNGLKAGEKVITSSYEEFAESDSISLEDLENI